MPTQRKNSTTAKKPRAARTIAEKRAETMGADGPELDPYAPSVWGSEGGVGTLTDITLPSGQRCLAQRPGPEGLMAAGLLDDLDLLSTVLPKAAGNRPGAAKKVDASHLLKNRQAFGEALKMINRITVHVVVKPELTDEPDDPKDKEIGKIYPSSVSMEDKLYLFNWAVGGTRDLQSFREQLKESVADLESGEDVEGSSE